MVNCIDHVFDVSHVLNIFQIDEKGSSILTGFYDGVVRLLNFQKASAGSHTRRNKDQSELTLKQVFKPHKERVTAMALDHQRELLATGVCKNHPKDELCGNYLH